MDKQITHNGKQFSVDEIKKDFDTINKFIESFFCCGEFSGLPSDHYTTMKIEYDAMKFLFCDLIEQQSYDNLDRPIFKARDICRKYVTVDKSKKPAQPPRGSSHLEYRRAFSFFQNQIMLEIEDLVLAYNNPEWSEIYINFVYGCDKKAHRQIIFGTENAQ